MDLALYNGQRPADVLKIDVRHVVDGHLLVDQNKTGKKLRIAIKEELRSATARIMEKSRDKVNQALLQDTNGQTHSSDALRSRFDKGRALSSVNFQFRDLRRTVFDWDGGNPERENFSQYFRRNF